MVLAVVPHHQRDICGEHIAVYGVLAQATDGFHAVFLNGLDCKYEVGCIYIGLILSGLYLAYYDIINEFSVVINDFTGTIYFHVYRIRLIEWYIMG